jgi:replicative DNA helicase
MSDDWLRGLVPVVPLPAEIALPSPPASSENGSQVPDAEDGPGLISSHEAIAEWIRQEQRADPGILTGWPNIDRGLDKPIRAGEVVAIGARTGIGKTWVVQHMIQLALLEDETAGAVILEMEMPHFHFGERLATHALDMRPYEARRMAGRGEVSAETILRRAEHLHRLLIVERGVSLDDVPGVLDRARRSGINPTILAVDYTGLIKWTGDARTPRYERVSEQARALKEVAKAERTIILAAVQLSRQAGDGTVEPTLEDFRDSGAIEEACDRAVMFWRDREIEDEGYQGAESRQLKAKIAKNRFGPTGYLTDLEFSPALKISEREPTELPY